MSLNNPRDEIDSVSGVNSFSPSRPSSNIKSTMFFGLLVVGVIFIGFGSWSATAPLAQAVAAYASLAVKGERKQVQHFEGGIIETISVTEGQLVEKGDLLIALNPLQAIANVSRHNTQFDQALVKEARLLSEFDGEQTIVLGSRLLDRLGQDTKVSEILASEERHLQARKKTLDATVTILKQRIAQLANEIKGYEIQRASRIKQLEIFEDEYMGLRALYIKGYYPKTKLLAVERAMADLRGAAGNDTAQIARAISARGEAENQIVSVKQRFREDVVKDLRDVQVELADLTERVLVAKDVLQRVEIKAPRSGIVQGINFHTIGGVVKPGDVLMDIAPQDDDLIVNARVSLVDIDSVAVGQKAEIRLTALNARMTPTIFGSVISVSGDSLKEKRTNQEYFLTRIEIPPEEKQKLGKVKLTAGMPADVLIQTGERTALNYILKPLLDAMAHGLNEE